MTIKYPDIEVQLTGTNSNAFALMGEVSEAMRLNDVPQTEIDECLTEAISGDYNHLLKTLSGWVSVS